MTEAMKIHDDDLAELNGRFPWKNHAWKICAFIMKILGSLWHYNLPFLILVYGRILLLIECLSRVATYMNPTSDNIDLMRPCARFIIYITHFDEMGINDKTITMFLEMS